MKAKGLKTVLRDVRFWLFASFLFVIPDAESEHFSCVGRRIVTSYSSETQLFIATLYVKLYKTLQPSLSLQICIIHPESEKTYSLSVMATLFTSPWGVAAGEGTGLT